MSVQVATRVSEELAARLRVLMEREQRSMGQLLRLALVAYVDSCERGVSPVGRLEAEAARLEAVRRIRAAGASEEEFVAALERAGVEPAGAVEQALGEQPSGQADTPVPTPAERPVRPVRPAREFRPYPKGGGG